MLDCGAHAGVFTRKALGDGARLVVAIEPAPDNLESLRRNLRAEIDAGRVRIYEKGVWDQEDSRQLFVDSENTGAHTVVNAEGKQPGPVIRLTTVERIVEELKLDRVDFIKMDIEGAEQRALAGARNTMARFKPRLAIAVYHNADDAERVPRIVQGAREDYRLACGSCDLYRNFIPLVFFFR